MFNYCVIINDYDGLHDDESIEINQALCSILIHVMSVLINVWLCFVIYDKYQHDW